MAAKSMTGPALVAVVMVTHVMVNAVLLGVVYYLWLAGLFGRDPYGVLAVVTALVAALTVGGVEGRGFRVGPAIWGGLVAGCALFAYLGQGSVVTLFAAGATGGAGVAVLTSLVGRTTQASAAPGAGEL